MLVPRKSKPKRQTLCFKERTFTLRHWTGNFCVVTARSFVSKGDSMGTRSVFVMCWRIKMPRLNNASLWQNTTDISVQIPYRLPRTECKHFRVFFFCFASLNFNLVIASALSLMCSERSELIFLTI